MLLIPYSPPKAALWEIVWLLRYQLTQHILDDWLHWIQQFSMTLLSAEFWLTLMGAKSNIGLHGKFIHSYFCYVPKHMRPKLFWVTKYPECKLRFHFNPPRAIQLQSVFRIIPCMAHISNMCSVLNWNSNSKAIKIENIFKKWLETRGGFQYFSHHHQLPATRESIIFFSRCYKLNKIFTKSFIHWRIIPSLFLIHFKWLLIRK